MHKRCDVPGTVYILKLSSPLCPTRSTAQFYVGWTRNLEGRIQKHRCYPDAAFMRAAKERGIEFAVIHTEPGTRADERRIKKMKNTRRYLDKLGIAY